MEKSIESLKWQISAMERKLSETPETIGGAYNRKYYSLKAKIKNLTEELDKLKWKQYLAK